VVAQALHVAQDDGEALVRWQSIDGLLNRASGFGAQAVDLGPRRRVRKTIRGALLVLGANGAERVQALGRSSLTPTQLVVARIHGNAQQPAAQPLRWTVERLQGAEGAQQRVLSRVCRVLGVAQGAIADVEDLALIDLDEDVEGADLAPLRGFERAVERARL